MTTEEKKAVVVPDTNASIQGVVLYHQSCFDVVRRCYRESKLQGLVRYNAPHRLDPAFVRFLDPGLLYPHDYGIAKFVRLYPQTPKCPELHFGLYSLWLPTYDGNMQTISLYSKCKKKKRWTQCCVWIHRTEDGVTGAISQRRTHHLSLLDSPYTWANSIKRVVVDIANGDLTCSCCVSK